MTKQILFSVTKKDLDISWYTSHGPGGQKKNKTRNACRIIHRASGAMVTAQERREQKANLSAALHRLLEHPKFKIWWTRRVFEIDEGETLEQKVDRMMAAEHLRVEGIIDGAWRPI
jgi:protein subunit release factor B